MFPRAERKISLSCSEERQTRARVMGGGTQDPGHARAGRALRVLLRLRHHHGLTPIAERPKFGQQYEMTVEVLVLRTQHRARRRPRARTLRALAREARRAASAAAFEMEPAPSHRVNFGERHISSSAKLGSALAGPDRLRQQHDPCGHVPGASVSGTRRQGRRAGDFRQGEQPVRQGPRATAHTLGCARTNEFHDRIDDVLRLGHGRRRASGIGMS